MTKQQELEILDGAIAELRPDSYLGPWLASVRGELERNIRSDLPPSPTLAAARAQCEFLIAEAKTAADHIKRESEKTIAAAEIKAQQAIDRAASVIRLALRNLTD